jgi:hypothetical protein
VKPPKRFALGAVGDWMTRALLYVLGAMTVQVIAYYAPSDYGPIFGPLATACWAFVIAALVGKVLQNLRDLSFVIPDVLADRPKSDATPRP